MVNNFVCMYVCIYVCVTGVGDGSVDREVKIITSRHAVKG